MGYPHVALTCNSKENVALSNSSKDVRGVGKVTFTANFHGEKFWTRTRSKYEDLGEFETIWLHKTMRLQLG